MALSMATAIRPVFYPDSSGSLVREAMITFTWHPGMSLAQNQRSIDSLHEEAGRSGLSPLLEVSTRSRSPLGVSLSAFNLRLRTPSVDKPVTVEAAFQSSKMYVGRGNLEHLLSWDDGRAIKAHVSEFRDTPIEGFIFEGKRWDLSPATAFYDYLYLRALCGTFVDEPRLSRTLEEYRGFTDIAYNPKRSFNCQARSCALFVALGGIDSVPGLVAEPQRLIATMKAHGYQIPDERPRQLEMILAPVPLVGGD